MLVRGRSNLGSLEFYLVRTMCDSYKKTSYRSPKWKQIVELEPCWPGNQSPFSRLVEEKAYEKHIQLAVCPALCFGEPEEAVGDGHKVGT